MIKLKNITIKNFLSIGNVTQSVNLTNIGLTLVLGHNLDLGGDGGNRNGVGKSALINAISYVLYGSALANIKKGNLINCTNRRGMMVTLEFDVNNISYRIERGRLPNVLKLYINDVSLNEEIEEGQGEMVKTQEEIEKIIGMTHQVFRYVVALNTYNEPFLALRASDQREIIEHLLGITLLSEKAATLKDLIKVTKDQIKEEEYRIQGLELANEQIKKSIRELKAKRTVWKRSNSNKIEKLVASITDLESLDTKAEIEIHKKLDEHMKKYQQISDIETHLENCQTKYHKEMDIKKKAENDIQILQDKKCYACGQELHSDKHTDMINEKAEIIKKCLDTIEKHEYDIQNYQNELKTLGPLGPKPVTRFKSIENLYEVQNELASLQSKLETIRATTDPYEEQIDNLERDGIQPIIWDDINQLHEILEHQEFLLKLLTNKDSFIRKRIIEQNLSYLNSRLNHYLTLLGLPHEVKFESDLNVSITELGRDLDFDNLSRGERNRLILGLSWSFRDVHESINIPIDFMAVDELLDNGTDPNGVEAGLSVLKKMQRDIGRNILLISHREELSGRVNDILYVLKENGFTTFHHE